MTIDEHPFGNRKSCGDVTLGRAAGAFWFPAGKVAYGRSAAHGAEVFSSEEMNAWMDEDDADLRELTRDP